MVSATGIKNLVTLGQLGHFDIEVAGAISTISGTVTDIGDDYVAIHAAAEMHVLDFASIKRFRLPHADSERREPNGSTEHKEDHLIKPRAPTDLTTASDAEPDTHRNQIGRQPADASTSDSKAPGVLHLQLEQLSRDLPEAPYPAFGRENATWTEDQRNAFGHARNVWNYVLKVKEFHRARPEVRPLWDAGLPTDDLQLLSLAGQLAFWGDDLLEARSILKQVRDDGPIEGLQTLVHAQYRLGEALEAAESCALLVHRLRNEYATPPPVHFRPWVDLNSRWAEDLGQELAQIVADTAAASTSRQIATPHNDRSATPSDIQTSDEVRLVSHTGRVDRIWQRDAYGFLAVGLPAGGRRTVFFEFCDVADTELLKDIQSGWQGTVSFTERVEHYGTPEETRRAIAITPLPTFATTSTRNTTMTPRPRTPHPQMHRASGAKNSPSFSRAKRLELQGALSDAADAYRDVIANRATDWRSAVKDLAWLLNRMGEWREALTVLDEYDAPSPSRATLNLRMHIFLKGKEYDSARKVIQKLYEGADQKQVRGLLKQDVYCLVAMSHVQQAIRMLERGIEEHPSDLSLVQLHDKLLTLSKETAQIDLASLEAVGSGLTPFSRYYLESATMVGADERSKARGYYDERDFKLVLKAFDQIRGRRQNDRAQFMLTLAVMCWKDPLSAGNYQLSELLRRFFTLMAEAELAAGGSSDVVRTFAIEALSLSQPQDVLFAIPALLDTYSGATSGESQERLNRHRNLLTQEPEALDELARHLPYYEAKCRLLRSTLRSEWGERHPLFARPRIEDGVDHSEQRRQADLVLSALDELANSLDPVSIAKIKEGQTSLTNWANSAFFRLDKDRLRLLSKILQIVERSISEEDYAEQQNAYDRARMEVARLGQDCAQQPTHLSVVGIIPYCDRLASKLREMQDYSRKEARSSLDVKDAFENDRYKLEQDRTVRVTLLLSVPTGAPPLEDVVAFVDPSSGLRVDGTGRVFPLLPAGQRREVRLKIEPTAQQIAERAFTVSGKFFYHYNDIDDERLFSIPVRLDDDLKFQPIPNPYEAYAGGTIVDDPDMFYGRRDVLDRIVKQVTSGTSGQCFVLYGQKRSGKSSVLAQVYRKLQDQALVVKVTMGEIDTVQAGFSFLGVCLSEVYASLRDRHYDGSIEIPARRPDTVTLEHFKSELRRIRAALSASHSIERRIVLLVDEFTYVFGYIKRGMMDASFMRLWKALLESGLINTVVVGQDSMPRFKQEFANEFGVTKDERLSYLKPDQASELAWKPIPLNGESRFRGDSLERLIWYAGASPWYMQIMCDRLVQKLNAEGAPLVTEADIDDVALELVSGPDRLGIEKFDPLITASADIEELFPRDVYLDVLRAIANSTSSIGILRSELYEDSSAQPLDLDAIVDDLVARDVVRRRETGHLRICVGLFERWLRANRPFLES